MSKYPLYPLFALLVSCNSPSTPEAPKSHMAEQPEPGSSAGIELEKNIRSIFQDSRGNYWFGTHDAGVYRYDGKVLSHFTEKDGLSSDQVQTMQEDQSGNLWFGTGGFEICRFDGQSFKTYVGPGGLRPAGKPKKKWETGPEDLWFYAGNGVYRHDGQSLEPLSFPDAGNSPSNQLSPVAAYCTLKDKKGNLWIGTQSMGVCRFDGQSFTWFKEKGLAGPAVRALFEAKDGSLWFGNNGSGLFRYDGKSLSNFTAENGLSNEAFVKTGNVGPGTLARIMAINEDEAGNLWIGTIDAGVWRYDGNSLSNYTTKDGLTSDCINAIYKDKKGAMLFGTTTGVFVFNGAGFVRMTVQG